MALRPQRIFTDADMTRGAHKVYPHFWTTFGYRTGPVYLATVHSHTYWSIYAGTSMVMIEQYQPLIDILLIGLGSDMVRLFSRSRQLIADDWAAYHNAWNLGMNIRDIS